MVFEQGVQLAAQPAQVAGLNLDQLIRTNDIDDESIHMGFQLVAGSRVPGFQSRVQRSFVLGTNPRVIRLILSQAPFPFFSPLYRESPQSPSAENWTCFLWTSLLERFCAQMFEITTLLTNRAE
jgi:hypothetical protein